MSHTREISVKTGARSKTVIHQPDYILLGITGILVIIGFVTLFSASALYGQERFSDAHFFIKRQFLVGILPGLIGGIIAYSLAISFFKKYSYALFLIAVAATIFVFIPALGVKVGGAARWLALGPITFQPAEILKLGYILYFAALLAKIPLRSARGSKKGVRGIPFLDISGVSIKSLITFFLISGLVSILLVSQPDIGTLGVILVIGAILYFVSGAPLLHIGIVGILLILAGIIFAHTAPYRIERIAVFLNPQTDPLGIGYHINQILIAVGSGGINGLGLGMSQQKFGFIPQPIGDSIFAIFAEEFGFIGAVTIIVLFLSLLWRGIGVARRAPDLFSQLACIGIVSWIGVQGFVNLGAMVGLIPLTGIPLPFFSYGGSALTALCIGMGIVLNISRRTV